MDNNTFNFTINKDDYSMLNNIKKQDMDKIIELIFKTGYEAIFPSKNTNDPLVGKITSLENTLERLIGIGSCKKGALAEYILSNHIQSRYGDINYIDCAHIPHSGDAHIKFDGNETTIMLESKNYTNKVNKDEIEKMKSDMIHCNIKWGIFLSWNSSIIDKREFDIDVFYEKGNMYQIIYVSNLSNDIDRIDMAIQLVRRLICHTSNNTITWIHHMIQNDIEKLNSIISKNYQLRIWYEEMETNMNTSMNKYYSKMRDYMYEMDTQIKEIILKIANTTIQSINVDHDSYNLFIEKYKDNKKLFPVIGVLLDILKEYSVTIIDDNMMYKDSNIGTIKVMGKKINVYWEKYKHTSELTIDNNINSFNMIRVLLKSI